MYNFTWVIQPHSTRSQRYLHTPKRQLGMLYLLLIIPVLCAVITRIELLRQTVARMYGNKSLRKKLWKCLWLSRLYNNLWHCLRKKYFTQKKKIKNVTLKELIVTKIQHWSLSRCLYKLHFLFVFGALMLSEPYWWWNFWEYFSINF